MNRERKRWAYATSTISFLLGLVLLAYYPDVEINSPRIGHVMKLAGSFLTVSVVISLLYSVLIKPSDDAVRKKELSELLDTKIEDIVTAKGKYGLMGFVDHIDFPSLFGELRAGQTLWWLDTFPVGAGMWLNKLKSALEKGVNVYMLVLDPESPNVAHRANELGREFTQESFKADIQRFLSLLQNIEQEGLVGKLEVRTYDELIGLPIYLIAEGEEPLVAYSGFFLSQPTAVDSPHLKWCAGEKAILTTMATYITEKWNRNINNSLIKPI